MNHVLPFDAPEIEQLIVIRVNHCIGRGVEKDPCRRVDDYYTQEGAFITRVDEWKEERNASQDV